MPWRKSKPADWVTFKGFEEAGEDNVTELTRVVTSNILNIDVPGMYRGTFIVITPTYIKYLS